MASPRPNVGALTVIAVFYVLYTMVANTFGSFRTYFLVTVGGVQQSIATAISFSVTVVGFAGAVIFSAIADSIWRRRLYPIAAIALVGSQVLLAITVGNSLNATVAALALNALAYPYVGEGLYKVWAQDTVASDSRAGFQGATIAAARAVAALFALVTPSLLSRDPALLFWLLSVIATAAMALGWQSRRSVSLGVTDRRPS